MSDSGKNKKRKNSASRGAQQKNKSTVTVKTIPVKKKQPQPVDPKVLEENRKKIHAAAIEAQNAVKKALDDMSDQVKYEEKYEE